VNTSVGFGEAHGAKPSSADIVEADLRLGAPRNRLERVWAVLPLGAELHDQFVNAEPAILLHLVPLADTHPEAVTGAARIMLRNGGVTAQDLPSLTEALGEPVGCAAMLSTLKVIHPGTALAAQLFMVERGVMLLEDAALELLDVIKLVRPSQNALSAIQARVPHFSLSFGRYFLGVAGRGVR
jgi:hypothetical protein